jgi:hypothetical protein
MHGVFTLANSKLRIIGTYSEKQSEEFRLQSVMVIHIEGQ